MYAVEHSDGLGTVNRTDWTNNEEGLVEYYKILKGMGRDAKIVTKIDVTSAILSKWGVSDNEPT